MNKETVRIKRKPSCCKTTQSHSYAWWRIPFVDPIIFYTINEETILKAALRTKGAAGPSVLDADGWRRILVSKNFGKHGINLRSSIAK